MRRRGLVILAIAIAIAVAAILALGVIPVKHQYFLSEAAVNDLETTCTGILTSPGSVVSFHWSAPSTISFGAWSCSANHIVYQGNGTNGTGTFTSIGGVYEFGTICPSLSAPPCVPANVSGTYTGPLLAL